MFLINWGEIEGRHDAEFYMPSILKHIERLKSMEHQKLLFISQKFANGSTPSEGKFEQSGVLYYRSQDIGLMQMQKNQYISIDFDEKISRSRCRKGDVLVAIVGATLGKVGFVERDDQQGNINQNITKITVTDSRFLPKYVAIFLDSKLGQQQLYRLSTKTAQSYLNNNQLGKVNIPVVSKSVQNDIINIIEIAYQEAEKKKSEAQDLLNSINDYILNVLGISISSDDYVNTIANRIFYVKSNDIFDRRLDPSYHTKKYVDRIHSVENGRYPIKKLNQFIKQINYGASIDNHYTEKGIPLLRIKDLRPNEIIGDDIVYLPSSLENKIATSRVREGDILISRSGTIGVCSVVDHQFDGFAFGSFMIKISVENIDPKYVSYVLNSPIGAIFFERNRIGAIQGNITIPVIQSVPIPVPSIIIQQEIVRHIDSIRKQVTDLKNEAEKIVSDAKRRIEKILLGDE